MRSIAIAGAGTVLLVSSFAAGDVLEVGPGKTYATPCDAIAAAAANDTIEVDAAGTYDGDVCSWSTDGLTIKGVNGRAKIDAAGQNSGGKATWVIAGNDTTIEDIELSGSTVPDQNGAGIRQEGKNLTVRRCYFHDNDDGILAGAGAGSEILIEFSEFANNGFGDGYSHNMYIGNIAKFTLRYSYTHNAKIGHLVKSRAAENYILYNRITDETGTASYELDLPNGGTSFIIGNLIQQSPNTDNSGMVTYRLEGAVPNNPGDSLFIVNNSFVNDKGSGQFINVAGDVATPAVIQNNVFVGAGTIVNQATAVQKTNFSGGDPMFVDQAGFDYQLKDGSPCKDAGSDPGMGGGMALTPTEQYVHPTSHEGRMTVGIIDIGAYELGGGTGIGGAGGAGGGGFSGGPGTGQASAAASTGAGTASQGSGGPGATVAGAGGAGSGDDASGDDGGCGCRAAGAEDRSTSASLALVFAAALAASRRRRSAREGRARVTGSRSR